MWKGFLLYEIKKILPKIKVIGFDLSSYGIMKSKKEIRKNLFVKKAQDKFKYKKNYFDLVISLACLHNLEIFNLVKSIKEIERVGKKNISWLKVIEIIKNYLTCNAGHSHVKAFFLNKNGNGFIKIVNIVEITNLFTLINLKFYFIDTFLFLN